MDSQQRRWAEQNVHNAKNTGVSFVFVCESFGGPLHQLFSASIAPSSLHQISNSYTREAGNALASSLWLRVSMKSFCGQLACSTKTSRLDRGHSFTEYRCEVATFAVAFYLASESSGGHFSSIRSYILSQKGDSALLAPSRFDFLLRPSCALWRAPSARRLRPGEITVSV
ncbi:hypothetical protein EVAR_48784_1 [Eumeta japonica]|uniref:Uncharacterized protein n=1 Tax=Eumeta variegata TaxID=151549 RepID=A0A4C1Y1I4_EUMVA|nr:hypothetical protein EVAR_48784_1 [Eumeta japonica]